MKKLKLLEIQLRWHKKLSTTHQDTLAVKRGNATEDLKTVIILLLSSIFIAALQNQELDFWWPVIKNPILHSAQQPWGYWKPLTIGNLHISTFNNK